MLSDFRIKNVVFLKPNEQQVPFVGVEVYPRQIIVEDKKKKREIVIHPSDKASVEKKGINLAYNWYIRKNCKFHNHKQGEITCLVCGETFCSNECFASPNHKKIHKELGKKYVDLNVVRNDSDYKDKPISRKMVYVPSAKDVGKQLVLQVKCTRDSRKEIVLDSLFAKKKSFETPSNLSTENYNKIDITNPNTSEIKKLPTTPNVKRLTTATYLEKKAQSAKKPLKNSQITGIEGINNKQIEKIGMGIKKGENKRKGGIDEKGLEFATKTAKVNNFPTGNFDLSKETIIRNLNFEINKRYYPSHLPKYVDVNQGMILGGCSPSKQKKLKYFTIMNYNILADIYSTAQMFPTTSVSYLDWNFRKRNLLREILSHSADIICLQEVQNVHFTNFFEPELKKRGYVGLYKKKTKKVYSRGVYTIDGCATFWKTKKFDFVRKHEVEFRELALKELESRDKKMNQERMGMGMGMNSSFINNLGTIGTPGSDGYQTSGYNTFQSQGSSNSSYGSSDGQYFGSPQSHHHHQHHNIHQQTPKRNLSQSMTSNSDFRRLVKDNISLVVILKFKGNRDKNKHRNRRKLSKNVKHFFEHHHGLNKSTQQMMDDFVFDETDDDPLICIGNVHIMANVKFNDVKLWQIDTYLNEIEKLTENGKIPAIISGDFNSTPNSSSYRLIVDGELNKSEIEDKFNQTIVNHLFPNEKDTISHSLDLCSSYSQYNNRSSRSFPISKSSKKDIRYSHQDSENNEIIEFIDYFSQQSSQEHPSEPSFTNKCYTFNGTLDYIFYSKKDFLLSRILKIPQLQPNEYLPNDFHSSDHVPLLSEFVIANKGSSSFY